MSEKQELRTKYGTLSQTNERHDVHEIRFYRSTSGREPVREWLKQLEPSDRKRIGEDLYTLQLGWPVGMPLARKLLPGLWELRCSPGNGIARVIFTARKNELVLLNGFVKKSQKLPGKELAMAERRVKNLNRG